MKVLWGIVLLAFALATTVRAARPAKPAWEQEFLGCTTIGMFPDNLGHTMVLSTCGETTTLFALNSRGRVVAQVSAPIPNVQRGVADRSGTIFLSGAAQETNGLPAVYVAALAPRLGAVLWTNAHLLYPTPWSRISGERTAIISLVPRGTHVFAQANWEGAYGPQFSLLSISATNVAQVDYGSRFGSAAFYGGLVAHAPDGSIYGIAQNLLLGRYGWLTISRFSPSFEVQLQAQEGGTGGASSHFVYAWNAVCDNDGNLIVVGTSTSISSNNSLSRRAFTMKMGPSGNVLWRASNGPWYGRGSMEAYFNSLVATGPANGVVVSGSAGTLKYSPHGTLLWTNALVGLDLLVDSAGGVLVVSGNKAVEIGGVRIDKLLPNGKTRWYAEYGHKAESEDYFAGAFLDQKDDLIVGLNTLSIYSNTVNSVVLKYQNR